MAQVVEPFGASVAAVQVRELTVIEAFGGTTTSEMDADAVEPFRVAVTEAF
jgi:hypothetical protein